MLRHGQLTEGLESIDIGPKPVLHPRELKLDGNDFASASELATMHLTNGS